MRLALISVVALSACGSSVAEVPATPEDAGVDAVAADTAIAVDADEDTARADAAVDMARPCVPGITQCTNCIDDDGDGVIDGDDPECHGRADNDEKTFGLGNALDEPCQRGCRFDELYGGDDPCAIDGKCVPATTEMRCAYDRATAADPKRCPRPSETCRSHCFSLMPPQCDCFGCCVVRRGDAVFMKQLVDSCTIAALGDETNCPSCSVSVSCAGSAASYCPTGVPACDPANPCPPGLYCLTGCCIGGTP